MNNADGGEYDAKPILFVQIGLEIALFSKVILMLFWTKMSL